MVAKKVSRKKVSGGRKKDTSLALLSHLLALFTGFLAPLIILLVSEDKFSKDNAKLSLNWQISLIIYSVISLVLLLIIIGLFTFIVLAILNVIFCIIASVKASEGVLWKYPLTIPFFEVK